MHSLSKQGSRSELENFSAYHNEMEGSQISFNENSLIRDRSSSSLKSTTSSKERNSNSIHKLIEEWK